MESACALETAGSEATMLLTEKSWHYALPPRATAAHFSSVSFDVYNNLHQSVLILVTFNANQF